MSKNQRVIHYTNPSLQRVVFVSGHPSRDCPISTLLNSWSCREPVFQRYVAVNNIYWDQNEWYRSVYNNCLPITVHLLMFYHKICNIKFNIWHVNSQGLVFTWTYPRWALVIMCLITHGFSAQWGFVLICRGYLF